MLNNRVLIQMHYYHLFYDLSQFSLVNSSQLSNETVCRISLHESIARLFLSRFYFVPIVRPNPISVSVSTFHTATQKVAYLPNTMYVTTYYY